MCADNVSGGVEPVFTPEVLPRPINTPEGLRTFNVQDYGAKFLDVRGKAAAEVTAMEHVAVLAAAQAHVDSSVSKTVNMTGAMPWSDFKEIYRWAWEHGCKSCSTFNADGKRGALLVAKSGDPDAESDVCIVDPTTGQKECG